MDLSLFGTISCSARMVIRNKKRPFSAMSAAHVEAKGTSDATEVGEVAEDKAEQLKMNASSVVFELIDSFIFELGCCH